MKVIIQREPEGEEPIEHEPVLLKNPEVPNQPAFRILQRRMSDGRAFVEMMYIIGEEQDLGEVAQHLIKSEEVEQLFHYRKPEVVFMNLEGVKKLELHK